MTDVQNRTHPRQPSRHRLICEQMRHCLVFPQVWKRGALWGIKSSLSEQVRIMIQQIMGINDNKTSSHGLLIHRHAI